MTRKHKAERLNGGPRKAPALRGGLWGPATTERAADEVAKRAMYAPTGAALVRCEMALWRSGTAGQTAHWTRRVRLARCLSTAAGVELSWSHLHHRESNSESTQGAEPVFVMHGLLGNKMNWRSLFRSGPLGELNRDVLVADARNHGASPHHSQMSYCAMVDDVLRLLDEQEIDRVIAVGHSMGGKTAMQLALRAPDRVERLVVCDIAPVVCVVHAVCAASKSHTAHGHQHVGRVVRVTS
jgi:pimeloyl-ACP methyl ester carboxylesterase